MQTYSSKWLQQFIISDDSKLDLYLSKLNENSRLAVAISREHARNFQRNARYELYCFENSEIIYDYALKFIVRKDFPYLNELNAFIRSASGGGLIEKWRLNNQIKTKYKRENQEEERVMMIMEDLYGPILVVGFLVIFIFLIFLFEFLVYKKKRTHSGIWLYLEWAIDSDRHFMLETISLE